MVDDEDKARRLAKAICADVMLYNAAVKEAPLNERAGLISGPISEGRALYLSRVSPRLAGLFEAEVAASVADPLGVTPASIHTSQAPRPPALLAAPVLPQASGGNGLVIAVAVLLLVASIAAFFFFFRG